MQTIPFDGIRLVILLIFVLSLPVTVSVAGSVVDDDGNGDAVEPRLSDESFSPEFTTRPQLNIVRFRDHGTEAGEDSVSLQVLVDFEVDANINNPPNKLNRDVLVEEAIADTEKQTSHVNTLEQDDNVHSRHSKTARMAGQKELQTANRARSPYSETFSGSIATVSDRWDGGELVGNAPVFLADEWNCSSNGVDCAHYFARFRNARSKLSVCDNWTSNWDDHENACRSGIETGWLINQGLWGLKTEGWIAQGFTANPSAPKVSRFNGPVTFVDRPNKYQLNQLYTVLKRDTHTLPCKPLDLGGRIDLLYGTDARFTLARGLDDELISDSDSPFYKLSFPQMYAEAGVCDWKLQFGRFYTILGYENVTAPDNFFVSHSYTMQYGEPFTHTGFLATGPLSDEFVLSLGATRGWDVWDDNNGDADFLGGVVWNCPDSPTTLSFAMTSGPQDDLGVQDRVLLSAVVQHEFCGNWNYVFHGDYAYENDAATGRRDAEWYGIINHLIYDVNNCWSLGIRQEWFSDDDGVRVEGLGTPRGIELEPVPGHWQDISLGLNYRPSDRAVVRSEARWDWYSPLVPTNFHPFDDGTKRSQFLWTIDLIVGF